MRVGGQWRHLYRAVDGTGRTIDFLLSAKRDRKAAERFFRKALGRGNTRDPREIVAGRLESYPGAVRDMKRDGEPWRFTRRWSCSTRLSSRRPRRCRVRRHGSLSRFMSRTAPG